jgi:hypothetical protein
VGGETIHHPVVTVHVGQVRACLASCS